MRMFAIRLRERGLNTKQVGFQKLSPVHFLHTDSYLTFLFYVKKMRKLSKDECS